MKIRHATHPDDIAGFDTRALRERFVADDLFVPGTVSTHYSHHDRMVIGGALPRPGETLVLPSYDPLRSEYFCQRRELAVVAVGSGGTVTVDGERFELANRDVLYVGRGSRDITFTAPEGESDAAFYLASALAHVSLPTTLVPLAEADASRAGSTETANLRTVYKHIHAGGVPSAQLVLGITALDPGSVWNSMPPHLHDRRTEIYLYMDLPAEARVQHVMGEPDRTRGITLADREAVISPSWSVHFGSGTQNYAFVWVMAGENQEFTDMDQVAVTELS